MGDPGPPLCLAREIGIFVGVPDDDAGVVIRFALAQRGTRVLDLGQRRGSRSPCGPQNILTTSGKRYSANFAMKLSEKWFEQSYDRELAGIRTSDIPKTRGSGGPKDHTIAALGTFQTVS
jgi:hypothetical protein